MAACLYEFTQTTQNMPGRISVIAAPSTYDGICKHNSGTPDVYMRALTQACLMFTCVL